MNQTFFGITGQQTADSQGLERKTGNPSAKLRRTSPAPDSSARRAAEALTSAAQCWSSASRTRRTTSLRNIQIRRFPCPTPFPWSAWATYNKPPFTGSGIHTSPSANWPLRKRFSPCMPKAWRRMAASKQAKQNGIHKKVADLPWRRRWCKLLYMLCLSVRSRWQTVSCEGENKWSI